MPLNKSEPVLIIGAGTFGLSTAHKLATLGHTNVAVLEKDDRVPSRFSGGFDLNKIIRSEYIDPFYTDVALQAIRQWQTSPLYQPHFRQVGFLNVITGEAPPVVQNALFKYNKSVAENPAFDGYLVPCQDAAAIRKVASQFTGELPGWKGYLNRLAGYAQASNAMQAVYKECVKLGVVFHVGLAGEVEELLYEATDGNDKMCIGARTKDGVVHTARTTIVAAGGFVANVLPAIGPQISAVCWGVSHIQLTPSESEALRGFPVTTVRDIGFFFEPDPATHKIKICYMGGGYTNVTAQKGGLSVPYASLAESEYIPEKDVKQTRRLLRQVLPHIAERPLIDQHLCWVADTGNSDFIIDFVPGTTNNSLAVLSGDSGHGFKMMPIVGDWAADLLSNGEQKLPRWRWREPKVADKDGRPTHIAWRATATIDLSSTPRAKL
ncbi:hypothetical protein Sste5346_008764 [Sporothrix stenoceras]|uniref:FAD dependent oxidoreductase domain-containing protein n=1 Tax=Sporothrix stenoceras TaxID=5173 RepID=A0ABR3YMR3_9PEZI